MSALVSLTRGVKFYATHRLYRPDWPEAQNRSASGPVADPPGHGHDYRCEVAVRALPPGSPLGLCWSGCE